MDDGKAAAGGVGPKAAAVHTREMPPLPSTRRIPTRTRLAQAPPFKSDAVAMTAKLKLKAGVSRLRALRFLRPGGFSYSHLRVSAKAQGKRPTSHIPRWWFSLSLAL